MWPVHEASVQSAKGRVFGHAYLREKKRRVACTYISDADADAFVTTEL